MWPFRRQESKPQPPDVVFGDLVASYDADLKQWFFNCDGFAFTLSSSTFDPVAFRWATEAAACIRQLERQIQEIVAECLPSECNVTAAEIHSVDLDEFADSQSFDIYILGDRSWGDCGVNISIQQGAITDFYGSD